MIVIGLPAIPGETPYEIKKVYLHLKKANDTLSGIDTVFSASTDKSCDTSIIDVRSSFQFNQNNSISGSCRKGSIWNAINIPLPNFKTKEGRYSSPITTYRTLRNYGVKVNKPIIIYDQSGIQASEAYLVLKIAQIDDVTLYDGGWAEYSCRVPSQSCENMNHIDNHINTLK